MSIGKVIVIHLIAGQIKKRHYYIKGSYYTELSKSNKVKVELDLPNYATKYGVKKATGVNTSDLLKSGI